MSAKLSKCCNATIGWDAWVDSDGEVCGGPYDASQCMECGESDPEHAEPQGVSWGTWRQAMIAPDASTLLAALQELLKSCERRGDPFLVEGWSATEKARAAIAKAEGEP